MPLLRLLFLTLALFAASPLTAQEDGPTGTITTETSAAQDGDIAARIRDILGELGGYNDVTVTVSEGIVFLRGTTTTAGQADALTPLAARVEGVVAVRNDVVETRVIVERLNPAVDRFMTRLEQVVTFLPLLLIAGTLFGVVVFIGILIARMRRPWEGLAPNRFIADLFRQLVRLAFIIGGLVIALDVLNATALLSTILGAAGIVGLAFGFAVRDTVENYIASILLSIRQPFRPNDTVEINGDEGKVIRLTSRATILLSFDGNHIRIPNSTVFKSRIVNYSQNDTRRFKFAVAVDWNADIARARTLAEQTVQDLPFVIAAPAASTWIDEISDSGIAMTVTGWINQHETSLSLAKGEALRQVKLALEAEGITLPDTTYAIRVTGGELPASTDPGPRRTPAPASDAVETVGPEDDSALDAIIEAERDDAAMEDLLSADAAHE